MPRTVGGAGSYGARRRPEAVWMAKYLRMTPLLQMACGGTLGALSALSWRFNHLIFRERRRASLCMPILLFEGGGGG